MYDWEIIQGMDRPIKMGIREFETSNNMNTIRLILQPIRALCSRSKSVII